jgi:hypothetical protein
VSAGLAALGFVLIIASIVLCFKTVKTRRSIMDKKNVEVKI